MIKYIALISLFFPSFVLAQNTDYNYIGNNETKLFGEITIESNYLQHGLTQTQDNPAIDGALGYSFGPLARVGVDAHNVSYSGEDVSFELSPFLAYKFLFTPNADLDFRYFISQYFHDSNRNSGIFSLDLNVYHYHIIFENDNNFEGTHDTSNHYTLQKEFDFTNGFLLSANVGYNLVQSDVYTNYFDFGGGVGYLLKSIKYALKVSDVTNGSQFSGRGGFRVFAVASAVF